MTSSLCSFATASIFHIINFLLYSTTGISFPSVWQVQVPHPKPHFPFYCAVLWAMQIHAFILFPPSALCLILRRSCSSVFNLSACSPLVFIASPAFVLHPPHSPMGTILCWFPPVSFHTSSNTLPHLIPANLSLFSSIQPYQLSDAAIPPPRPSPTN